MSAQEALHRYQLGLARTGADIPNLLSIATTRVLVRYPDYWQPRSLI
jgi:hypothetical protein